MSNGSQKTTGKFLFILDNILYIVFYTFPYKIHQLLESSSLMFFNIVCFELKNLFPIFNKIFSRFFIIMYSIIGIKKKKKKKNLNKAVGIIKHNYDMILEYLKQNK